MKRATTNNVFFPFSLTISIHALVKRATNICGYGNKSYYISIHALVKRATFWWVIFNRYYTNFNPRPREEGDRVCFKIKAFAYHFNPRPREEGDLSSFNQILKNLDFNPRPREEGDLRLTAIQEVRTIFQSTPSWRGRPGDFVNNVIRLFISIHALVKRATYLRSIPFHRETISIHALVKRATTSSKNSVIWFVYFNPRPREEGDNPL